MDMMRALRAHTRGGPGQLVCEQAPVPVPQHGEALVIGFGRGGAAAECVTMPAAGLATTVLATTVLATTVLAVR